MKKIFFFLLAMSLLASCSNEGYETSIPSESTGTTKSAADKVFTAELIATNIQGSSYSKNGICTDLTGNLYYFQRLNGDIFLRKYDIQSEETSTITSFKDHNFSNEALVVDSEQYIYFTSYYNLYMISQDGTVQDITSRFPQKGDNPLFLGLCSNNAGMVYVTMDQSYRENDSWWSNNCIYRFSAKGNVVEMVSGITQETYATKASGLTKSAGVHVYGIELERPDKYIMVDVRDGTLEQKTSRLPIHSITADPSSTKVYILNGRNIYHMRPTANSDILIGTIPNDIYYSGYNNYLFNTICTTPGAAYFYIMVDSNIYKLTLE